MIPLESLSHNLQAYLFIHGGISLVWFFLKHAYLNDHQATKARQHKRNGHTDRFKYCQTDDCATSQNGAAPAQPAL